MISKVKRSYRQTTFHYTGYNTIPAKCGLEIHQNHKECVVILQELPDNTGASITNAIEKLATQVYSRYLQGVEPETIQWIEHYTENVGGEDHYLVKMGFKRGRFVNPSWQIVDIKEVLNEQD
jgi:hypothetical protein